MGKEGKEESQCPRRVRKHCGDRTSGERIDVFSTSIPRTREYGDIYPLDSFSLDLGFSGLSFSSPRLLFAQPKKTRHTLCSHNSTILCWRLALLLVPLSVWFFHIHPFRPSALTFPHHTVPRMFFVPLPLSHCHRSPLSSSMPPSGFVSASFPPSPSNLVVSFAHDIHSIHGPSPNGRTGRCDHMWTVRPVLFLALPPMPSRCHFPPPPVV